jgi:hypothetical protein
MPILARPRTRAADRVKLPGVKFSSDHEFPAPPAAVATLLCDPDFQKSYDLPDLGRPEVVLHTSDGNARHLRLRYEYLGQLDPIARRLLGNRKLTWIQDLELDLATTRGTLKFSAEAEPDRLYGNAQVALDAVGADGARRHIEGDLYVRVPLVGGTAERRIVPGLVSRLDVEAAAVTAALKAQG